MPRTRHMFAFLLVFVGGCNSESSIEKIVRAKSPTVSVSARNLLDQYVENQIHADETYKGEIIEVTGSVSSNGVEFPNTPYLMLNASDIGSGVQCFFSTEHKEKVRSLKAGVQVSIRGRCEGFNQGVRLEGCIID